MENQETKAESKGCCDAKKCCGGKALAAVALLLVGGLGGFFAGRHCGKSCDLPAAQAPAK